MNPIARTGVLTLFVASLAACAGTTGGPARQAAASVPASQTQNAGAPFSGTWHGTLTDPEGIGHPIEMTLAVNGTAATGTITGVTPEPRPIDNGKVQRDRLSFEINFKTPEGMDAVIRFEGTVYGNRIRGVHGSPGMPMDLVWEATRQ